MAGHEELADAFISASRALVGLAVASVGASPVEVTLVQHRVLVLLAARGEAPIGVIAEELAVNPSNASRHCDRLQRLGLLERRRSAADGRVVHVALTEQGREVVDAVTRRRREEVVKVLAQMPEADRRGVVEALDSFRRAAHELSDREWATNAW